MREQPARLHGKWIRQFQAHSQWEPTLIFGYKTVKFDSVTEKDLRSEITQLKKFLRGLKSSLRQYDQAPSVNGFASTVAPEKYPIPPPPVPTLDGFGRALLALTTAVNEAEAELKTREAALQSLLKRPKLARKTGQRPSPHFFGEQILVALELHKGNGDVLRKLRAFLEPGGGFEKWIKRNCDSQSIQDQLLKIPRSNSKETITDWRKNLKVKFELAHISRIVGHDVKSIGHYGSYRIELRSKIRSQVAKIRSSSSLQAIS